VLSGAELYARLVKAGRTVPTVLVAGGGGESAEQDPEFPAQIHGMLFKPLDPNALLSAIGAAVSRPAGAEDPA